MKIHMANCLLIVFAFLSLAPFASAASLWTTDSFGNLKTDFSPLEPVYIHGESFDSDKLIDISVTGPDGSFITENAISDSSGNFIYEYTILKTYGSYDVFATDGINSAQLIFTDSANFDIEILQPLNATATTNPVRVFGNWSVTNNPPGQLYQYKVQIQWGDGITDEEVDINRTEIGNKDSFIGNFDTEPIIGCNASDGTDNCNNGNFTHKYNITQSGCGPFNITVKLYHSTPPGNEAGDSSSFAIINITEICGNGINDDCDNLTDCADSDCTGNPVCALCGNGIIETGEECDPGGNYTNDCCANNCKFEMSSYTCRGAAGECDISEQCSGSGSVCPADTKSTSLCRASSGKCDLADYCNGIENDCPQDEKSPLSTPCDDGLWCSETDHCDGNGNCVMFTTRDCSGEDVSKVDTCFNNPDNNPFTHDYRNPFFSSCIDDGNNQGHCATGDTTITHTCSVPVCGAICDVNHTCTDSICSETYYDYCTGKILYEYDSDKILDSTPITDSCPNNCQSDCSCSECKTDCSAPTENTYCVKGVCDAECSDEVDCAPKCIDNVYYSGGSCSNNCECSFNTENCDLKDGWYDTGDTRWVSTGECTNKEQKEQEQRDYSCSENGCKYIIANYRWVDTGIFGNKNDGTSCDDGQFCTVNDACTSGVCSGSSRDCSENNIPGINTCFNNPDNNPYTLDFRNSFTSICNEENDSCTTGNVTITHACSYGCDASCIPGQSVKRCLSPGTSIITVLNGKCYMVPEFDTCLDNCSWSMCQKIELPITDPRCNIQVQYPTCGGFTGIKCTGPTTTIRSTTSTVPRTATTMYVPKFTFPTFTIPNFSLPGFVWK